MEHTSVRRRRLIFGTLCAVVLVLFVVDATRLLWQPVPGIFVFGLPIAAGFVVLASADWRAELPGAGGVTAGWLWICVLGYTSDALEGTRFDFAAVLHRAGAAAAVPLSMLASYGGATGLGFATWVVLKRRLRRPPPGFCQSCGYDLRGIEGLTACPECGAPCSGARGTRPD